MSVSNRSYGFIRGNGREGRQGHGFTYEVETYLQVVDAFIELLQKENQALEDYDMEVIRSLYDIKAKTVGAYRTLVAYFMKHQESLKELDKATAKELKEASAELDELLNENDMLLKTRMETSKTIMDSIVNIAKVAVKSDATSYGAEGFYSPQQNGKNALAINRTL